MLIIATVRNTSLTERGFMNARLGSNSDLDAPKRGPHRPHLRTSSAWRGTSEMCANSGHDAPPARSGDQWFGQRQAAEALSSGSLSDFAENGLVR